MVRVLCRFGTVPDLEKRQRTAAVQDAGATAHTRLPVAWWDRQDAPRAAPEEDEPLPMRDNLGSVPSQQKAPTEKTPDRGNKRKQLRAMNRVYQDEVSKAELPDANSLSASTGGEGQREVSNSSAG